MSQPGQKFCPFDWTDGVNDRLAGGRLLAVRLRRFAYAFYDGEEFKRAVIAGTTHGGTMPQFLTEYPDELSAMFGAVLGELKGEPYNLSGNVGLAAGVSVDDHPHLHVIRRFDGEPASGWGMDTLIRKYNELWHRHAWTTGT